MWRALFLAIGISACILGAECLVIDEAVFAPKAAASEPAGLQRMFAAAPQRRSFEPPEWAPWSLISGGVVILLYTFTLPRGGGEA